jgi:hypothetical protein
MNRVLSSKVATGTTVGEVWSAIARPGQFKSVVTEDLIPLLVRSGANPSWSEYIDKRYGGIGTPR